MHFFRIITYQLRKQRWASTLLLFFLLQPSFLWPASMAYSQNNNQGLQEYSLKAIYLYNFLQFVHWPKERCLLNGAKVEEIAVIGDSPIGESLQVLKEELKKTQNTQISVRFLGPYVEGMDLSGCRLLFITKSEMKNIKKILADIGDEPVLTVSDTEDCLDLGCMIALISRMNKVRWAVNRESAERAGLRMSTRLLAMAVEIVD